MYTQRQTWVFFYSLTVFFIIRMYRSGFVRTRLREKLQGTPGIRLKPTPQKVKTNRSTQLSDLCVNLILNTYVFFYDILMGHVGVDIFIFLDICLIIVYRPKTFITCRFFIFFFLATTSRSAQIIGKNDIQIYKSMYRNRKVYI